MFAFTSDTGRHTTMPTAKGLLRERLAPQARSRRRPGAHRPARMFALEGGQNFCDRESFLAWDFGVVLCVTLLCAV